MGVINSIAKWWADRRGTFVQEEDGAYVYYYNDLDRWNESDADKLAFTIGNVIMFRSKEDVTPAIIRHELTHVRQIRDGGGFPLFLPKYLVLMAAAYIFTGDTDNNPYEAEALRAELD
jgi:hypothetical protein